MCKAYEPIYYYIDEIYVQQVVFEKNPNCDNVSIFGYFDNIMEQNLKRVDYFCNFSLLTDLLIAAKEDGELVINAITEKLNEHNEECLVIIDIENMFGIPLKIEEIILKIYKPMEENENGEMKEDDDNSFIIDTIESKDIFEKRNCYSENLSAKMVDYFSVLESSYFQYLQLIKFENFERQARKYAGLKNKFLFKMAELHYQIVNEKKLLIFE